MVEGSWDYPSGFPFLNEMKYFVEVIREGNHHGVAAMSEAIASYRLAMKELKIAGGMTYSVPAQT